MRWQQVDNYHVQSDSGYRVSKATRGPGFPPIYVAWPPRDKQWIPANAIAFCDSADEAKAACEKHADLSSAA